MSAKRAATTDLNHDNWDQDDPSEHEQMGTFKPAPKEVLEKRVIRTAKRRAQAGDQTNKSVFSGFGGFNKSQPSSFDFLANLTNGNKAKQDEPVKPSTTPSLFGSASGGSTNGGLFKMPVTSTPSKSTFGTSSSQPSVFGGSSTNAGSSLFSTTSSAANAMFKGPSSEPQSIESCTTPTATSASSAFGSSTSSTNSTEKSMFSIKEDKSTPVTIKTHPKTSNASEFHKPNTDSEEEQKPSEEKKLKYYSKLKGLNESVSDWIKKHVQETPLCILSPIFKDYENHLKEIQDEYNGSEDIKPNEIKANNAPTSKLEDAVKPIKSSTSNNSTASTLSDTSSKPSVFSDQAQEKTMFAGTTSEFSFGFGKKPVNSNENTTSGGLSFGANTATTASSLFSSTNTFNANGSSTFSFGTGKPFSFISNVQPKPAEDTSTDANEEDEPPKVEFTPVVEENSVFDKKCKIFVKKDGNFVDKGVGTLYIKTVEGSEKHQLLVRANTSLGNILLNLILTSEIPTQRLGKNNVMMVCIPTPDSKPPPVAVLVRVKTSEEADQLLETLNKYKV